MSTPKETDPLVGHRLAGKYLIERLVGSEELGQVYDALLLPQNDPVLVKVLHPHLVEDPEAFARFGREMLATAAVNHPNTVAMLDFGDHNGLFYYLVLEHLDARPLQEVMKRERLSIYRVCHIGAQVASALSAAHREGIVHRNLNPSNILLLTNSPQGDYVKIRDFGLAKITEGEGSDEALTDVGMRLGHIEYMAPEYIREGTVAPSIDLYALGVLLYHMATSETPFKGLAPLVMDKHLSSRPPRASDVDPEVPDWLDKLILALLEKEPHHRLRNAAEVLQELQRGTGKRLDPPALGAAGALTADLRAERDPARRRDEPTEEAKEAQLMTWGITAVAVVVLLAILGVAAFLALGFAATFS